MKKQENEGKKSPSTERRKLRTHSNEVKSKLNHSAEMGLQSKIPSLKDRRNQKKIETKKEKSLEKHRKRSSSETDIMEFVEDKNNDLDRIKE